MSVEGLDGFEVVSIKNFEDKNAEKTGHWNGRSVSTKRVESSALPSVTPLSSSEESTPKKLLCGAVGDYFDPDSKEAQQFEINVLLHSIHCKDYDEEQEKYRELLSHVNSIMHAAGVLAVAVFSRDYKSAAFSAATFVFLVQEKLMVSWSRFQEIMKERGTEFEDVHFYTLWEDYEKNREDLIARGIIIEGCDSSKLSPLDPSFKPFQPSKKPLDPSFKPITSA